MWTIGYENHLFGYENHLFGMKIIYGDGKKNGDENHLFRYENHLIFFFFSTGFFRNMAKLKVSTESSFYRKCYRPWECLRTFGVENDFWHGFWQFFQYTSF